MTSHLIRALALSSLWLIPAEAVASQITSNMTGSWAGTGKARVPLFGNSNIRCKMTVSGKASRVSMSGTCRSGVFAKPLRLTLRSNDGDRYTGTYSGTRAGLAKLSGRQSGNRLNLTIEWPKPVNGDHVAQMTLTRIDDGRFQQVVTDMVNGKRQQTASLVFSRR